MLRLHFRGSPEPISPPKNEFTSTRQQASQLINKTAVKKSEAFSKTDSYLSIASGKKQGFGKKYSFFLRVKKKEDFLSNGEAA
jgi:hypothetical protein